MMRHLLIALIVLSGVAVAQQTAPDRPAQPKEIPNRYQLPNLRETAEGSRLAPDTPFDELRRLIETPPVTANRLDAVNVWIDNIKEDRPDYWQAVSNSVELLQALFRKTDEPLYRRHAISLLFGSVSASVRDYIPLHWRDPHWRSAWKAFDALRRRGMQDPDRRLAEFFERFEPLPAGPDWKSIKSQDRKLQDRLEKTYPERLELLKQIWDMHQSVESSQLTVRDRVVRASGKYGVFYASTIDYRMYCTWANLYPRVIRDMIGQDAADSFGLKVYPVKLGWPHYPLQGAK